MQINLQSYVILEENKSKVPPQSTSLPWYFVKGLSLTSTYKTEYVIIIVCVSSGETYYIWVLIYYGHDLSCGKLAPHAYLVQVVLTVKHSVGEVFNR